MKIIRLHGEMGRRFGREFVMDVLTTAEAVQALCATVTGFRAYLIEHADDGYKVFVGTQRIDTEGLIDPVSDREVIRIAPVVAGAGGDFGKIIVGAALIYFSMGTSGVAITPLWGTTTLGSLAGNIGFSLILGGVASMLSQPPPTPTATTSTPTQNTPSKIFDGAVNTTAQGNPVPLCYGRVLVGSHVVSAGLTTT